MYVHAYMPAYLYVHHMPPDTRGGQERALDPLELQLKVVVGCLMWVLGTKPVSPARDASILFH